MIFFLSAVSHIDNSATFADLIVATSKLMQIRYDRNANQMSAVRKFKFVFRFTAVGISKFRLIVKNWFRLQMAQILRHDHQGDDMIIQMPMSNR